MSFQSSLLFHPERVLWIGVPLLSGLFLAGSSLLGLHWGEKNTKLELKTTHLGEKKIEPISFALGLDVAAPSFLTPNVEGEMTFSFDPPRPDGAISQPQLLVRLKKAAQSKRMILPGRIDLQYLDGERLVFAERATPFWVDLSSGLAGQIEANVRIATKEKELIDVGRFVSVAQESPLRSAQEFSEGTPFRVLAEARWWGRDLFREKYGSASAFERLDVGPCSDFLEISDGDWLVWREGRWQKSESLSEDKGRPIAHIQSVQGKLLILEGWDADHHIRISLNPASPPPFKSRADELFSSIRVRSEKQISCMIEKQCLILKTGDWVLKKNGRWKILRKKEERESFLNGKLIGDVFVFDKIETKQGQKFVQGQIFNPGRSQAAMVEMAAHSMRKSAADKLGRKQR